jgi:hypothetical protein
MNFAYCGATAATAVPGSSITSGAKAPNELGTRMLAAGCEPPKPAIEACDRAQVQAIEHGDRAAIAIVAIEPRGHGKQNNREQEKQVDKHDAAMRNGLPGESPVMADPENASNDEAQHQRDQPSGIDIVELGPARRRGELRGARQVIGEQGHGHTEDGVAERFQPPHLEIVGGLLCHFQRNYPNSGAVLPSACVTGSAE